HSFLVHAGRAGDGYGGSAAGRCPGPSWNRHPPGPAGTGNEMKRRSRRALIYLALVAAQVFALFPFWWMITTSLKHQVEIFGGLEFLPQAPTLDNFAALFDRYNFGPFSPTASSWSPFPWRASLLLAT